MINSFNPVARAYTEKVSPYRHYQFLALAHELNLKGHESVLDIGSGPGVLSVELARRLHSSGSLIGVDISPNMIRLARETARLLAQPNVAFTSGDALHLEYPHDSFDVVVSSNAFPWVSDRRRFLGEVARVLKPGGKFGLVALSREAYREFSSVLRKISRSDIKLFPRRDPFGVMGAKLHSIDELVRVVSSSGLEVAKRFQLSTKEPISPRAYVERVNAIVGENYLMYGGNNGNVARMKSLIHEHLSQRNGQLTVTESSVFIIAHKQAA